MYCREQVCTRWSCLRPSLKPLSNYKIWFIINFIYKNNYNIRIATKNSNILPSATDRRRGRSVLILLPPLADIKHQHISLFLSHYNLVLHIPPLIWHFILYSARYTVILTRIYCIVL